jgi:hypothetical protein
MLRGIRFSSADIVTKLQDGQSWLRFPGRIKKCFLQDAETGSGIHPSTSSV